MSDIDLAVNNCKRLESLLERKLGATGRGLHEKVSSVETRLPHDLVRKLRLVATVRNKIVHEAEYKNIDDRKKFLQASKESEKELKSLGGGGKSRARLVIVVAIIVVIVAAVVLYKMRH
jgi:t-SNARE complex subunit (syntaxin)